MRGIVKPLPSNGCTAQHETCPSSESRKPAKSQLNLNVINQQEKTNIHVQKYSDERQSCWAGFASTLMCTRLILLLRQSCWAGFASTHLCAGLILLLYLLLFPDKSIQTEESDETAASSSTFDKFWHIVFSLSVVSRYFLISPFISSENYCLFRNILFNLHMFVYL